MAKSQSVNSSLTLLIGTAGIIKELSAVKSVSQEKAVEDMGINLKTYQSAE